MGADRWTLPRGIQPRRSLGQHFLLDEGVLRREVAYAEVGAQDAVLEIGPGIGNLTELLLQRAGGVVAVEKDRQFGRCLERLQRQYPHLQLIWGDARQVEFPPFDKVVANLPYHIALPLVFKLLERRFAKGVLVVQKRLAERICAGVGDRGYGRLSVALGRRARLQVLEVLGREVFRPPPEVESAIVGIERLRPRFAIPSESFFKLVLEELFRQRQHSVEEAVHRSRRLPSAALARVDVRLRRKPVCQVTPRQFGELARAFEEARER